MVRKKREKIVKEFVNKAVNQYELFYVNNTSNSVHINFFNGSGANALIFMLAYS